MAPVGDRPPTSRGQKTYLKQGRGRETDKALSVVFLRPCLCPNIDESMATTKPLTKLAVPLSYTTSHSPSPSCLFHSLLIRRAIYRNQGKCVPIKISFVPTATVLCRQRFSAVRGGPVEPPTRMPAHKPTPPSPRLPRSAKYVSTATLVTLRVQLRGGILDGARDQTRAGTFHTYTKVRGIGLMLIQVGLEQNRAVRRRHSARRRMAPFATVPCSLGFLCSSLDRT